MFEIWKKLLFVLIVGNIALSNKVVSADFEHPLLLSFEKNDFKNWELGKGQKLSRSEMHFKHGNSSLQWNWHNLGNITLRKDIGFVPFNPNNNLDTSIPSFVTWIYNEKPLNTKVKFVFGSDKTDQCWFSVNLNFKGWRNVWVSFERDMEGKPEQGMNFMRIETPEGTPSGSLFFDHMVLCINIDSRHHSPDYQVPFVNKNTTNHWLQIYNYSQISPDIQALNSLSAEDVVDMKKIEDRFLKSVTSTTKTDWTALGKIKKEVDFYQIVRTKQGIKGLPIWFTRNAELYIPWAGNNIAKLYDKNNQELTAYFDLMLKVSLASQNSEDIQIRNELQEMFVNMFDHMEDQGIACGSSLGTIHHYGYSWRSYYRALYLMKDYLRSTGRLKRAVDGMFWYSGIGETFKAPESPGMDMDAFNTVAVERLASVLMLDDSPEKVQKLACFSRWFNNGLLPSPGLADAFKTDGSVYHHANNYPAYGIGGLDGACQIMYFFSGTRFCASQTGHQTVKNALLTMRLYCNLDEWPVSMAGRHPGGAWKLVPEHFALLADAGTPDGKLPFDREMAEAYLRLIGNKKNDSYARKFQSMGLAPEPTPQGDWMMPYASVLIHRRDGWSATVRGHSRYLWAAEHYIGANYYGRYMAHGNLQVLDQSSENAAKPSGFSKEGWDWNRFPGTTAIHLPLDKLRANVLNVDQFSGYEEMLYSDEAFAGGVSSESGNGIYAFKLHEHDKYNGSLRARKSYFFFDNQVVCIGSGIENTNEEYPTETTLFQTPVRKENQKLQIEGMSVLPDSVDLAFNQSDLRMIDPAKIAYYIPSGKVAVRQGMQISRDPKTEKENAGLFATAVIDHGKAPQSASYLYYMLINTDSQGLSGFAAEMKKPVPLFKVLQNDNKAHIVWSEKDKQLACVFFEPAVNNTHGIILQSNIPFIGFVKEHNDSLSLSVSNPDLALYSGPADEIYANGKRVERSIYSRPWKYNESQETILEIELRGKWALTSVDAQITHTSKGTTLIRMNCKNGTTKQLSLISL